MGRDLQAEPSVAGTPPAFGVTVVLPTYKESSSLPLFLPRLVDSLSGVDWPWEAILVDDDSPDATRRVADEMARRLGLPLTVIVRKARPRSLSDSILLGALRARFSLVAAMDCDLSHDPGDLPALVGPLFSGEADLAIGSRYLGGSAPRGWPLGRRLLSMAGTRVARRFVHVRDPLSGFFAFRRDAVVGLRERLRPRGYKLLLAILAHSPSLRVEEVPISFGDRAAGRSKLGARQIVEFAMEVLELVASREGLGMGIPAAEGASRAPTFTRAGSPCVGG